VTPHAAQVIRDLVAAADLPDGAGLRIAQRDDHTALAMTLSEQARDEDATITEEDATVFLGPAAAHRVQDQTLDAKTTGTTSAFYLRD
jgi:Fe-S cluster assembly iron-binding protein IscA